MSGGIARMDAPPRPTQAQTSRLFIHEKGSLMSTDKAVRLAAIRAANAARAGEAPAAPTPATRTVAAHPAPEADDLPPAMSLSNLIGLLLAAVIGVFAAVVALPTWLQGLSASLLGTEPKAYWYLARSSAWVAYGLLWLAMVFGLLMINKLARAWPGGPMAFDLHQHTSLLGLAFALFHGLILLGDRYIQASLTQILLPFAYTGFNPLAVGLGQIALYGLALVGLSFYVKAQIGRQLWRAIHLVSFSVFALALLHGIFSGSDSSTRAAQIAYWATGGAILFLTIYRILISRLRPARMTTA
jgi:hypothetical protein